MDAVWRAMSRFVAAVRIVSSHPLRRFGLKFELIAFLGALTVFFQLVCLLVAGHGILSGKVGLFPALVDLVVHRVGATNWRTLRFGAVITSLVTLVFGATGSTVVRTWNRIVKIGIDDEIIAQFGRFSVATGRTRSVVLRSRATLSTFIPRCHDFYCVTVSFLCNNQLKKINFSK